MSGTCPPYLLVLVRGLDDLCGWSQGVVGAEWVPNKLVWICRIQTGQTWGQNLMGPYINIITTIHGMVHEANAGEDCGFTFSLKRHKTLPHNLGEREHPNVKIVTVQLSSRLGIPSGPRMAFWRDL